MIKTLRNKKPKRNNKNKTVRYCEKKMATPLFNGVLKEWKKQTNGGNVTMDVTSKFACDFYLSDSVKDDTWNHVHLVRDVRYPKKYARLHGSGFCFKKRRQGHVSHSKIYMLDVKDTPKNSVKNMLSMYKTFKTLKRHG